MTNTVTPGGGAGGGAGNVYAATAPPMAPGSSAHATPHSTGRPTGAPRTGQAPDPPATAPGTTGAAMARWVGEQFSGAPGRLRLTGLACVLLGLLLGGAGFYTVDTKANGLAQARRNLDQLVTVQQAYTALAEADSQATNLFLRGGLEDPEGRRVYLDRIDLAGRALSRASSGAQDLRTRTDLQAAHVTLTRYAGLVESARANNRQGFPIGVAYLKQASALLRSDVLPTLAAVQTREEHAVEDALRRGRGGLLTVVGGAVVLLLGLAQFWLFKASRRILNLPLVAATTIGLLALILVGSLLDAAAARTQEARAIGYRSVVSLAGARIAAFDAKSNESLALIARGNGAQYEKVYQELLSRARAEADRAREADPSLPDLSSRLFNWGSTHEVIRRLDDTGRWEQAVDAATRSADASDPGSNAAFAAFDGPSRALLDQAVTRLDLKLGQPLAQLRFTAVTFLLAGLLMAAAGWAGLASRVREFR